VEPSSNRSDPGTRVHFPRNTPNCQVVKGQVWTFDQTQSLDVFEVFTPVRMTVIKLKSGRLWVHAPVAPTGACNAFVPRRPARR
jgi:hypothetical protein